MPDSYKLSGIFIKEGRMAKSKKKGVDWKKMKGMK